MSPHHPVMLNEVVASIKQTKKSTIIDCTFGCGGYSQKILETFPSLQVIAIDRDPSVKNLQKF